MSDEFAFTSEQLFIVRHFGRSKLSRSLGSLLFSILNFDPRQWPRDFHNLNRNSLRVEKADLLVPRRQAGLYKLDLECIVICSSY